MELAEVFKTRRSVRAFENRQVEDESLQRILEAMNSAPSAGNIQGYAVVAVRDTEKLQKLVPACMNQESVGQASVALIFFADTARSGEKYGELGETLFSVQDATIACTFAMLALHDLGLATVWIGAFHPDQVATLVNAPDGMRPVAILPIGYPAETPGPTPRRDLSELVHQNSF